MPDSWIETYSSYNPVPLMHCQLYLCCVPIICSCHLFAQPFIFISTAATYQLTISGGNSNYLCTCVLHTINAAPLINATLLIPPLCDQSHRRMSTTLQKRHMQTQTQTHNPEQNIRRL